MMPNSAPDDIKSPEITGSGVGWVSSTPKSVPTGKIETIEKPARKHETEL